MNIATGTKHEVTKKVTSEITAAEMGSGSLAVFATPAMVALMEQAASELCDKYTEEGISTVGTGLDIRHLAATAVGAEVKAVATVTSCDGRKITFDVEAFDNAGLIGKGTHERVSIKTEKFMQRAEERKNLSAE